MSWLKKNLKVVNVVHLEKLGLNKIVAKFNQNNLNSEYSNN